MPVYFFSSEFYHKKHQKLLKKIIPTIGFAFLVIILLVKKKFRKYLLCSYLHPLLLLAWKTISHLSKNSFNFRLTELIFRSDYYLEIVKGYAKEFPGQKDWKNIRLCIFAGFRKASLKDDCQIQTHQKLRAKEGWLICHLQRAFSTCCCLHHDPLPHLSYTPVKLSIQ